MKIKYAECRIRNNIGHGLLMIGIGLFWFILKNEIILSLLWSLFGVLQMVKGLYIRKNPYLSIENNKITKLSFFPKSVEIHKIRKVWKYVNSYKIETSDITMTIDKHVMEPESLIKLTDFLNDLELDFRLKDAV